MGGSKPPFLFWDDGTSPAPAISPSLLPMIPGKAITSIILLTRSLYLLT
jgi:hypothetical protein